MLQSHKDFFNMLHWDKSGVRTVTVEFMILLAYNFLFLAEFTWSLDDLGFAFLQSWRLSSAGLWGSLVILWVLVQWLVETACTETSAADADRVREQKHICRRGQCSLPQIPQVFWLCRWKHESSFPRPWPPLPTGGEMHWLCVSELATQK